MNDSTWTWISGSNILNQPGVYGEKGIASTGNHPGARYGAVGWYDSLKEEFWLFGGSGYSNSTSGAWFVWIIGQQTTHLIWSQDT